MLKEVEERLYKNAALRSKIVDLKLEIEKLEKDLQETSKPDIELAKFLHNKFCKLDHSYNSECGFKTGTDEEFYNLNSEKNYWRKKAINLLETGVEFKKIIEILEIL